MDDSLDFLWDLSAAVTVTYKQVACEQKAENNNNASWGKLEKYD